MKQSRKYLDPLLLSKLGNMDLVARCAVEGFFAGLHPSPFHGFSVEAILDDLVRNVPLPK